MYICPIKSILIVRFETMKNKKEHKNDSFNYIKLTQNVLTLLKKISTTVMMKLVMKAE